jgi:hypothetical protein
MNVVLVLEVVVRLLRVNGLHWGVISIMPYVNITQCKGHLLASRHIIQPRIIILDRNTQFKTCRLRVHFQVDVHQRNQHLSKELKKKKIYLSLTTLTVMAVYDLNPIDPGQE